MKHFNTSYLDCTFPYWGKSSSVLQLPPHVYVYNIRKQDLTSTRSVLSNPTIQFFGCKQITFTFECRDISEVLFLVIMHTATQSLSKCQNKHKNEKSRRGMKDNIQLCTVTTSHMGVLSLIMIVILYSWRLWGVFNNPACVRQALVQ